MVIAFSLVSLKYHKNNKVFVIAEAGVSHFGSLEKAKKLIDLAKVRGRRCKICGIYYRRTNTP